MIHDTMTHIGSVSKIQRFLTRSTVCFVYVPLVIDINIAVTLEKSEQHFFYSVLLFSYINNMHITNFNLLHYRLFKI